MNINKNFLNFFIRNFLKSFLWLIIIVTIVIGLKKFNIFDFENFLSPFYKKPLIIYLIFLISEIFIGIIPPEFFMIWATHYKKFLIYISIILLLSTISYFAGIVGYWIGKYLNKTLFFRYLKRRFLIKLDKYLNEFGMFIIILSAMTPLPFSGTSMLIGSSNYSFKKYLIFSLSRYVRFIIYSLFVWEATINL